MKRADDTMGVPIPPPSEGEPAPVRAAAGAPFAARDADRSGCRDPQAEAGPALEPNYLLRLYVSGHTANSVKAIANIKALCDRSLGGRCEIHVIDIYEKPMMATADQIVAVPTLVRVKPAPMRRLIGDMSNHERVLSGLGLPPAPAG